MKIKHVAAALITVFSVSAASANQLTPVYFSGSSFANLEIGTITLSSLSNLTGNLFAADSVTTMMPPGTWTLDSVTFSGGSIGSTTFSTSTFSLSNLAAGSYTVKASGSLISDGQIHNAGFIGANYQIIPVPEPESYAMFLAGLGLMGVIARRRRSA